MIGIQSTIKDSIGTIWLNNYQVTGEYENRARISRVKTLDGGAVLSHYGTSVADRDLKIDLRLSNAQQAALKTLFENGTEILISFWEGAFIGLIYQLRIARDGVASIIFMFKEQAT